MFSDGPLPRLVVTLDDPEDGSIVASVMSCLAAHRRPDTINRVRAVSQVDRQPRPRSVRQRDAMRDPWRDTRGPAAIGEM